MLGQLCQPSLPHCLLRCSLNLWARSEEKKKKYYDRNDPEDFIKEEEGPAYWPWLHMPPLAGAAPALTALDLQGRVGMPPDLRQLRNLRELRLSVDAAGVEDEDEESDAVPLLSEERPISLGSEPLTALTALTYMYLHDSRGFDVQAGRVSVCCAALRYAALRACGQQAHMQASHWGPPLPFFHCRRCHACDSALPRHHHQPLLSERGVPQRASRAAP